MVGRPVSDQDRSLALVLVGWWETTSAWWPWRRHAEVPPASARAWMHPSELGSFDSLSTTAARLRSRAARAVATLMVVALVAGGAGLASTRGSPAVNDAMTSHLTITVPGHVTTVAAMALPHDLAVTTTPIPHGALLTGSVPGHQNFPVTWVGRDQVLGFSLVHLGLRVPALAFAPLPATAAVVAVAPIITDATSAPRFAWADTTLGDPTLRADGAVSYLVTRPHHNLNGVTDALAVNAAGRVVAVLSSRHLWFSAQFVARVANVGAGASSSPRSRDAAPRRATCSPATWSLAWPDAT